MAHRIARTLTTALALAFLSLTLARAQDQHSLANHPAVDTLHTWEHAQYVGATRKEYLRHHHGPAHAPYRLPRPVPLRRPTRLQALFQQTPHLHASKEVAALTTPSDDGLKLRIVLALNGVAAAAIWGTVVLASTCIPCAVATGVAAFLFLVAAGGILAADDQPETLLYLAPGQKLQVKGYIEQGHPSH